ncbi:MAG: bifunctional folylpolyglutamate synthase/dihydrofolate synthase [Chloroflexi bacterium]|nr:bifunctional folylpolyglutamate synthase/dihydrofolate synthase [Chloroflexota bacterium]
MDYPEALQYLLSFTNLATYRHIPYSERVWNLSHMETLAEALGRPHLDYHVVHIAGTKGKGSTAAMIESTLRQAGLRPGLYTSPHLHTFRERMRVDGHLIPKSRWVEGVEKLQAIVERLPFKPTLFELLTALGFWYFSVEEVPIAVVEVGLGGRLDSTNIVHPDLTLITSLGLEHTAILGDTLADIAREKGGIIKPGVPVVVAPQEPEALAELERLAKERQSPLLLIGRDWHYRVEQVTPAGLRVSVWSQDVAYEDVQVSLRGMHQALNATMAIVALHTLREMGWPITEENIRDGLRYVKWPARMEVLQRQPILFLDGAHTVEAMIRLLDGIYRWFPHENLHIIFGVSADKRIPDLLDLLWPHADTLHITRSTHPRAATPHHILEHLPTGEGPRVYTHERVEDALEIALATAGPNDLICACGSIFLAAAVREVWAHRYGRLAPDDWAYETDLPFLHHRPVELLPDQVRKNR